MTQQNAALVEQTAAAASAMQDQARTLADEVGTLQAAGGQRTRLDAVIRVDDSTLTLRSGPAPLHAQSSSASRPSQAEALNMNSRVETTIVAVASVVRVS
jgi:hypothetical protein